MYSFLLVITSTGKAASLCKAACVCVCVCKCVRTWLLSPTNINKRNDAIVRQIKLDTLQKQT